MNIVYTFSTSNKGLPNIAKSPDWSYIAFTTNKKHLTNTNGWDVKLVSDETLKNQYIIQGHLFLPSHYISIYLDSDYGMKVIPDKLINIGKYDISVANLSERYSSYVKKKAIKHNSKNLLEISKNTNIPKKQLAIDNRFIVRKNNNNVRDFCKYWWQIHERHSITDMSISYGLVTNVEISVDAQKSKTVFSDKNVGRNFNVIEKPIVPKKPPIILNVPQPKKGPKPITRVTTQKEVKIFQNTPYREDKNLWKAYNDFMEMIPDDSWALFTDSDTIFLDSFYGSHLTDIVRSNPDADCLTAVTNRVGCASLVHDEYKGDDINIHRDICLKLKKKFGTKTIKFKYSHGSGLSGMCFLLKKSAWKKIGGFKPFHASSDILGVDNKLHIDLEAHGYNVKIMKGFYIYHWYRGGAKKETTHLQRNKVEKTPLINILTRSCNRPNGFSVCKDSINSQSYKNINHIVCYQDKDDLSKYLNKYKSNTTLLYSDLEKLKREDNGPKNGTPPYSPHNLHNNFLLENVEDGWVIMLDDDDMLHDNRVIERIVKNIRKADENTIIYWKMQYPDGRAIPIKSIEQKKPIECDIGTPCFAFHSKWAKSVKWDAWKRCDFRFINKLHSIIPNAIWTEDINISLNNFGDFGSKNDIKI